MPDRVDYTQDEILANHPYVRPLEVAGKRCHGGFLEDNRYQSPRTLHRVPAIEAWRAQFRNQTGREIITVPKTRVPPHFPNVAQTKFLLSEGVKAPVARILTIIGIVEGFGAMLRMVPIPFWKKTFVESVDHTAIAHLTKGLIEAHARDEAGYGDEAGHSHMWFAVRDLALDHPYVPADIQQQMMSGRGEGPVQSDMYKADKRVPDNLAALLMMASNVLVVEHFAEMTFTWAEEVLGDPDVCSNAEEAAHVVNYIRRDEAPHVGYLETVLSEMSARTIIGTDGSHVSGQDVVETTVQHMIDQHNEDIWARNMEMRVKQIEDALADNPRKDAILEEFLRLGDDKAKDMAH